MILPDVNVLVYAYVVESERHDAWREWWESVVSDVAPFALTEVCLTGFVRVVTHPKVLTQPLPVEQALDRAGELLERPNCTLLRATQATWPTFLELCSKGGARGNTVPDAWIAALAISHGCELATADRGFSRWPGLRWFHPLTPV